MGNRYVEYEKSVGYLHPELVEEWDSDNIDSVFSVAEVSNMKVSWICKKCNHKWKANIGNRTRNGNGCPACAEKAVTDKNRFSIMYPKSAKEWHPTKNGDKTPDMFSHGSHKEFWWLCGGCGNEWFGSIKHKRNIKPNTCPICTFQNRSKRVSDDKVKKIVEDAGYILLSIYRKKSIRVIVQDEFLYKYDTTLDHLIDTKRGIAIVHKGNPFSFENIKRYLEINNKSFKLIDGKYVGTTDKLNFRCSNCGDIFNASWSSISTFDKDCPLCVTSHGEEKIKNCLRKSQIVYIPQATFDDCKNIYKLPFDFYLPENEVCIEYNGKQHYEAIKWFGGKKAFNQQVKRDGIKKEYCENNNIELLVIPYWDFDNIEEILLKELNIA